MWGWHTECSVRLGAGKAQVRGNCRRLTLTPQHLPVTVPRPWLYGQLASGPDSRRLPLCIYDLHGLDLPWIVGTGLGGPASLAWILPVPPRSQHLGPGPTRRPMRLTGTWRRKWQPTPVFLC